MKFFYLRVIFLVVLLGYILVEILSQNNSKDNLIRKRLEIEGEIELANKLLEETKNRKDYSLQELTLVKTKIRNRNRLISEYENGIALIDKEINENSNKLQLLKGDLEKAKSEYADLIYYAFKNRNKNLNIMYLLASQDINQFYVRLVYLKQYKEFRRKKVETIIELKGNIEETLNVLFENRQEKINAMNEIVAEKSLLISDQSEVNSMIKILKKKETDLIDQIDEKKKLAKKLDKEIEDLIKKESSKSRYDMLTPEDRIISDEFAKNKGRLPWPTEKGVITENYGEHEHPVIKNLIIRNNGIDITSIPNTKVRAIFNGEVSKIFTIKGANTTVIIRHGNYYTVYHNLVNVSVKKEDFVAMKTTIGEIYYDDKIKQCVLHFEIWKELEKQNPEEWLSN